MNASKVWNIAKTVLTWLLIAVTVFVTVFTLISVNTFDRNDRSFLGFKFFIVQTDSMAATDFDAGDIVIAKNVDVTTLKEGDIITFVSEDPDSYGETVTHKIRRVIKNEDGSRSFVTYGTTTNTDDRTMASVVVGKYVGKLPKLGAFFLFLKTTPGYIVFILIPFLLLILSQGVSTVRLFRRYKKEQMEEMEAERAKLEAERAESQRMMAELMALKAQLAKQKDENAPAAEQPPTATPKE